jgi:circadian clock protein KaiC
MDAIASRFRQLRPITKPALHMLAYAIAANSNKKKDNRLMTHLDTTLVIPYRPRCRSGCVGLDDVLGGGFPRGYFYLLEGEPGTGKTTLALQFIEEGLRNDEKILYITLSESPEDLHYVAKEHGLRLDDVEFVELKPNDEDLKPEGQYSVFHPSEIELGDRMQAIVREVERHQPDRLVIDALSELRMLAKDPLRFRRQVIALRECTPGNCTVLLLDDRSSRHYDIELHSIVHGVIVLGKVHRDYGTTRRRVEVTKLRGCAFREGYHDYIIQTGGMTVYPRLVAAEHLDAMKNAESARSGIAQLDALVGGGLDRGTSTLLLGPAGCGKTTIALRWLTSSAERGENTAAFIFEETIHTLMRRASGLGMNLEPHLQSGKIRIHHLDPAELSPGEFISRVRQAVDEDDASTIIIDSLNGFLQAMPGEQFLALHLHELLTYLNHKGVVSLMVLAQAGVLGGNMQTPADVSYLADNILVLRYFEALGEVKQAISMIKKRSGPHEHTIRELRLGPDNIWVGEPLTNFHGVLSGIPQLVGQHNGDGLQPNE